MGRTEETVKSKDGTELFLEWSPVGAVAKATVCLIHGYDDHHGRYTHVRDALNAQGFSVVSCDYRGHGSAGGMRGAINRFSEFLEDFDALWLRARELSGATPLFPLAHSLGGLILTHALVRGLEGARGAILSSPYYALSLTPPPVKLFFGRLLGNLWGTAPIPTEIRATQLSRDPEWVKKTDADQVLFRVLRPRFFNEATAAQLALAGQGPKIKLPLYMFNGGNDPLVSSPAGKAFFDTIGSADKQYKEYPGMLHETMNELGKEEVLADIARWISAHV